MKNITNNNIFKNKKPFFLAILFAIFIAFIDILSKKLVFSFLENKNILQFEILPFFNLVKVWNRGVSFGMFNNIQNPQLIFSIVVILISIFLIIWLYKTKNNYTIIAISFIIGGAFGNLYDRIENGAVADFLDFYIKNYHWPAFNIADSAVFIGVSMLVLEDLFLKKK